MSTSSQEKKTTLSDQIFEKMKESILSGEWPVGYRIPSESEYAQTLGVSRITVHSAFQRLQALGFIESRTGDGTRVKEFSLSDYITEVGSILLRTESMKEIAQFREVFEISAVEMAIDNATDKDLDTLKYYLDNMLAAIPNNDIDGFLEWDFRFHRCICALSGNSLFERMYDIIASLLKRYYKINRSFSPIDSNGSIENEDHVILYKYIADRDKKRAVKHYKELINSPFFMK